MGLEGADRRVTLREAERRVGDAVITHEGQGDGFIEGEEGAPNANSCCAAGRGRAGEQQDQDGERAGQPPVAGEVSGEISLA